MNLINDEDIPELSSHEEASAPLAGGLSAADPRATLGIAKQRMEQLTQLKEQMRVQAQARRAAMEQAAQMYEQPLDVGMDPGLIALGRGGASRPASQALLGFTEGMQGMYNARQKLAERDWARRAAAAKLRAESESQGMTDLQNEYKLETSLFGEESGHDWQMAQTSDGPVWSRIGADGVPEVRPIGGSPRDADRLIRVQSEVRKRADSLDAQFLSASGGDPQKASELKSRWIDSELRSNPAVSKLIPPPEAAPSPAMVRDVPSEKAAEARATTIAREEEKNKLEKVPVKIVEQIQAARSAADSMGSLLSTFKPEYGGKGVLGFGADTQLAFSGRMGLDKDAVEWWKNYKKQSELVERHAMFGASLTPGEQASWADADVGPGIDDDVIKKNLETRAALAKKVLDYAKKDAKTLYPSSSESIEEIAERGKKTKAPATPKDISDLLRKYGKH